MARYGEGWHPHAPDVPRRKTSSTRRRPSVVPNTRLALELGTARGCAGPTTTGSWTPLAEGPNVSRPLLEELARGVGVSETGIAQALDERP